MTIENHKRDIKKEWAIFGVRSDYRALDWSYKEFKGDKEVVLEAVHHYGSALQYASEELQDDKEVVLETVRGN